MDLLPRAHTSLFISHVYWLEMMAQLLHFVSPSDGGVAYELIRCREVDVAYGLISPNEGVIAYMTVSFREGGMVSAPVSFSERGSVHFSGGVDCSQSVSVKEVWPLDLIFQ